ncbi:MAG: hypothetical protein WEF50_02930 [Myxococcota bacterium]
MTRNAVARWNALGLSLLLGLAAHGARAEDAEATRTIESETAGTTTRTEDGRVWQRSTTGTVTGAQGVERDYQVERSGSVSHGDDGVTTRESTKTYTNEQGKQVTVEKSGTATKNADGSVSYQNTRTVTNPSGETRSYRTTGSSKATTAEDGRRTREGSTPTETGKTFTNDRKVQNSAGGSRTSHTEGQVTRNGDGTRSSSSHTSRQGTTARGKTWGGSADRKASYKRSDGTVSSKRTVTRSGSRSGGGRKR